VRSASSQDDAAIIQLKAEFKTATAEQASLKGRKIELEDKLSTLEVRINKTPSVEVEYKTLIRDQENIQNKYNDIRSKQNSARVSQSLEEEQKGERFTLIEKPRLAIIPHSPNFRKMYVMAIGLAFLGGLGSVFGLELLGGTIRSVRALESQTGLPVLATVGYIENYQDRRRRTFKKVSIAALVISLILGVSYLANTHQLKSNIQHLNNSVETIRSWVSDFELPR